MTMFFDEYLLGTKYLTDLRDEYEDCKGTPFLNPYRCYPSFLKALTAIYEYKTEHGKSFSKRIKEQASDHKNCEAIFTEMIVYAYYLPLIAEEFITSIDIKHNDYDLKLKRSNGSDAYFEIFCIMPDFPVPEEGSIVAYDVRTHTQSALSSVRQKLLTKLIKKQQLRQSRENYAVIELNNHTIAGDFAVPASLSNGYKIGINPNTMEKVSEGFDWSDSVFDDPITENLKAIIYFSLGYYGGRKIIFNPNYKGK